MANTKISALTAATTVLTTDLLAVVADPAGTPTSKKAAISVLATLLNTSPTFTGTPTLPTGTIATTQSASNNSTALATTAYVDTAVAAVDFSSDQNVLALAVFN